MLPFKNILFPVDYSEPCKSLVPYVHEMASHFNSRLTLVHAYHLASFATAEIDMAEPGLMDEIRTYEQQRLKDFAINAFTGIPVQTLAEDNEPGTLISQVVTEKNIDVVMMPTHGHGPLRRLLLGSVTGKVLHDVQATVFTGVGSTLAGHQPSVPFKSIVCAVSDGPETPSLLKSAAKFAESYNAKLAIIHVLELPPTAWEVDTTPYRKDLMETAERHICAMVQTLGIAAPVRVVDFVMPDAIHDEAVNRNADLIILGRGHAHGTFSRMWSHLYSVVRAAPCPVMSI